MSEPRNVRYVPQITGTAFPERQEEQRASQSSYLGLKNNNNKKITQYGTFRPSTIVAGKAKHCKAHECRSHTQRPEKIPITQVQNLHYRKASNKQIAPAHQSIMYLLTRLAIWHKCQATEYIPEHHTWSPFKELSCALNQPAAQMCS